MTSMLFLFLYAIGLLLNPVLGATICKGRSIGFSMLCILPVAAFTGVAGWLASMPTSGIVFGSLIGYGLLSVEFPRFWRISFYVGAVCLGLFVVFGIPAISRMRDLSLRKYGVGASATILEVIDTGNTVNDNPEVVFRIRVTPPQGEPYEAKIEKLVTRLSAPAALSGSICKVKYDPNNPSRVVFDED